MTDGELRILIVLHVIRAAFDELVVATEGGTITQDEARLSAQALLKDWRPALNESVSAYPYASARCKPMRIGRRFH